MANAYYICLCSLPIKPSPGSSHHLLPALLKPAGLQMIFVIFKGRAFYVSEKNFVLNPLKISGMCSFYLSFPKIC